ncbi:hypothetical protein OS493_019639 [Desmophyllum pertusum]|uniref:Uncharacterized protein n=1 Tax=Desmophyllum pertusum TaxID=174260 RepID=A0A9X0CWV6_9CNID|nr:hypothetical protein OS493_019639 [Desmophyllum pertusum]
MRVAVAFILLVSLAMAFKIEKERPVLEDEQDNKVKSKASLIGCPVNTQRGPAATLSLTVAAILSFGMMKVRLDRLLKHLST